jgi:3-oxoacyl-[acyl-carrier protein] reductase
MTPSELPAWDFDGRVAVVTGGARGIGRAIASAFGEAGSRVAICDVDFDGAEVAVQELRERGVRAESFTIDLSKKGAPQRVIAEIADKWKRLDFLINNARAGARGPRSEDDEDDWDLTQAVCLRAVHFASLAAAPLMTANGGGSIVNISSVSARLVSAEPAAYQVAKAGLIQLTRYLAANLGSQGIRANAILPGFIVQDEHREKYASEGNARYREMADACHPLSDIGSSSDVARAALFLCSAAAGFITGQELVVDGGLSIQDVWSVMSSTLDAREEQ